MYTIHTYNTGTCEIVKMKRVSNGHRQDILASIGDGYADIDSIKQMAKKANMADTMRDALKKISLLDLQIPEEQERAELIISKVLSGSR